jgi:hypothetical protein
MREAKSLFERGEKRIFALNMHICFGLHEAGRCWRPWSASKYTMTSARHFLSHSSRTDALASRPSASCDFHLSAPIMCTVKKQQMLSYNFIFYKKKSKKTQKTGIFLETNFCFPLRLKNSVSRCCPLIQSMQFQAQAK